MPEKKTDLLQGTLDLLVLKTLQAGRAHGFDITNRIQVVSEDALRVNYGSLYPALQRLEVRGLITSEWGTSDHNRRAKFYALTAKGRKQLQAEAAEWERMSRAIGLVLRAQ